MKTVMISGHFDPFHFAHLDYIRKASKLGDTLICVVSSDKQKIMKKGRVNEPQFERACILSLILKGLGVFNFEVYVNTWDIETPLVANALRAIKPDIFCRGTDKTPDDMPAEEKKVCEELGIQVVYIQGKIAHGSEMIF